MRSARAVRPINNVMKSCHAHAHYISERAGDSLPSGKTAQQVSASVRRSWVHACRSVTSAMRSDVVADQGHSERGDLLQARSALLRNNRGLYEQRSDHPDTQKPGLLGNMREVSVDDKQHHADQRAEQEGLQWFGSLEVENMGTCRGESLRLEGVLFD